MAVRCFTEAGVSLNLAGALCCKLGHMHSSDSAADMSAASYKPAAEHSAL